VRESLHKKLENLQESAEQLRQNALHTQEQALDELEKQIISLYRKVEERFEDYEITLISKEALDLGASLESGKMTYVAKLVDELCHNIHFLFAHRRPSMQHRKIVHLVMKLADQAHEILSTQGKTSKEQIKYIHVLRMLLREAVLRAEMAISVDEGELAMDLYEIADLLYRKKENEGRVHLNLIRSKLTNAQQRRLDAAKNDPEEMISILLEIADGDPCHGELMASAMI